MNTATTETAGNQGLLDGFLAIIERVGNKVPQPAIIFFRLIGIVIALSAVLSLVGWSATGIRTIVSLMLPYTVVLPALSTALLIAWYLLGPPLGPA